eukprot:CAMPEP_0197664990 /NCGR_PEP_ID=MMETSP1338-20131121/58971_1 /TAXON_ID=43686 ORGANISM="Pelagodinium beii, Strain RCC1491" /NCGR_SAMPLE_ID=MMETSP1338 /ASSEMBLY_ACC=CAM_ASM_000754 /LENGTH=207 /DNA_ID=CAMNT_0043243731 /DNA_START=14 /DNA_END=634 /DNA_ORIENTATION=-
MAMMTPQMWQAMMGADPSQMMGMGGMGKGGAFTPGAVPSGGGGPKKSKMCTFFLQGSCSKGPACTFAHDQSEIGMQYDPSQAPKPGTGKGGGELSCSKHGKQRSMRNMVDDGMGGMCCAPGFECQVGAANTNYGGGGGVQKKTKLCMYFQMGSCTKGPACSFAHGEWELGSQASVVPAAATAGSGECSLHGKKRSLRNLMDDGAGGM